MVRERRLEDIGWTVDPIKHRFRTIRDQQVSRMQAGWLRRHPGDSLLNMYQPGSAFLQALEDIIGSDQKRWNSKKARALVAVGLRDPNFRGNIGSSPKPKK